MKHNIESLSGAETQRRNELEQTIGGDPGTRLKLSAIVTDAGTQVRAGLNETTVADYAEALAEGATFPPVIVFHDGSQYIAADGFHRIHAALRAGATQIGCEVRKGSKLDALKFALGCNAHHGLRRTNADKRHAVGMALTEWPHLADAELARICAVGNKFVGDTRREMEANLVLNKVEVRIGHDGRERKLPPPPMVRRNGNSTPHPQSLSPIEAEREDVPPDRMPGATAATLPPPPAPMVDGTGWPIPTQLIPLWQRGAEVQEMLTNMSRVRGALRTAQETKDKLFAEVLFSSALSHLDQAWADVKTAKPFAVCPTCQGQLPDQCRLCYGRGLISEHRWNACVTREDKEFRTKVRAIAARN